MCTEQICYTNASKRRNAPYVCIGPRARGIFVIMDRHPKDTLTQAEAENVREVIDKLGISKASHELGLDERTLIKALALLPVHRRSAHTVRTRLSRL